MYLFIKSKLCDLNQWVIRYPELQSHMHQPLSIITTTTTTSYFLDFNVLSTHIGSSQDKPPQEQATSMHTCWWNQWRVIWADQHYEGQPGQGSHTHCRSSGWSTGLLHTSLSASQEHTGQSSHREPVQYMLMRQQTLEFLFHTTTSTSFWSMQGYHRTTVL